THAALETGERDVREVISAVQSLGREGVELAIREREIHVLVFEDAVGAEATNERIARPGLARSAREGVIAAAAGEAVVAGAADQGGVTEERRIDGDDVIVKPAGQAGLGDIDEVVGPETAGERGTGGVAGQGEVGVV